MRPIKLLSLFLALMLLMTSCGIVIIRDNNPDDSTEATTEEDITLGTYLPPTYPVVSEGDSLEEARTRLGDLPTYDFDGLSVFFATTTESGDIFNDETGLYVDAVKLRNQLVAEKYNTSVLAVYRPAATLLTEVKAADKADTFYADFAILRLQDLGSYYTGGLLRNLKAITHLDLEAPYYDADALDQLTVGGFLLGTAGAATVQPEAYGCLYYNLSLGQELSLLPSYEEIYSGSFTYEKLLTLLREVPEETPVFSASMDNNNIALYSYFATNRTFLSSDGNGGFAASYVSKDTDLLISMIKNLLPMRSDSFTYEVEAPTDTSVEGPSDPTVTLKGFEIFRKGYSLAAFGTLSDLSSLKNAGFRFEVLPFPKLNEENDYATPLTMSHPIIAVLASTPNIDTIGYVLEAVQAASYEYITEPFYENATKHIITEMYTLDMLDIILDNPVYDFTRMFGPSSAALREGTYLAYLEAVNGTSPLATYASRKETALKNYLKSLK